MLFEHLTRITTDPNCRAGCVGGACPEEWCVSTTHHETEVSGPVGYHSLEVLGCHSQLSFSEADCQCVTDCHLYLKQSEMRAVMFV